MEATLPQASGGTQRTLPLMVGICTGILLVVALSLGRVVFAPLAFSIFVIAMVWPLQAALQRVVPKILALALAVAVTVLVIGGFASVIVWAFSRVGRFVANDSARLQALYVQGDQWLEAKGIALGSALSDTFNVRWALRLAQQFTGVVSRSLSFSLIVLTYVCLGLLEADGTARKLQSMPGRGASILLSGGVSASAKLRRWMLVRTQMSVMTGVVTGLFIVICGLPLAPELGVVAFVLNYIPVIGPLVATVVPGLLAMLQFESVQAGLFIMMSLNFLQFLIGSYLEPIVAGNVLSISPFVMLLTVFFWTFLWGIGGAFIGIPITIVMLTFLEQDEGTRWIAVLLGRPLSARDVAAGSSSSTELA